MEKTKVLFISQEITPYLPETEMSKIGRYLPQGIQEKRKRNKGIYAKIWNG
jgi:starch synthase